MMELPPYLRTTLLRQRWLAAAERFELALAAREPDYPAQKKQALEWRLAEREAALHHAYDELHQLNLRFDPSQPRIPAGEPGAGQWTSGGGGGDQEPGSSLSDDSEFGGDMPLPDFRERLFDALGLPQNSDSATGDDFRIIPASAPSRPGDDGQPPGTPPQIPEEPPPTRRGITNVAKSLAQWMANTVRDLGAEASSTIGMLEFTVRTTVWLRYDLESIITYQDPAKSLGELYEAVDQPRAGTDIHHIMEQAALRKLDIPEDMINGPANLVRIPRYKHHEITAWYARKTKQFGGLPPREYLADKPMSEHMRVGLDALRQYGVLKP